MRRDGLDFREALERLAEKAGVELSERTAREDRSESACATRSSRRSRGIARSCSQATQAERARAYLAERGLSAETLDRFTIGYAPNTWDALVKRLVGKGYTNAELIGAGLASPSNRGGVIDKFRGRIIIPIRDASGRAVGLGGRIMPGAEGPKYLNSPATRLFDKSRTLYGIDLAKAAIRKAGLTVIVEGYTDVMAAHQAGFANVVASLGTALTHGQVELATRYADARRARLRRRPRRRGRHPARPAGGARARPGGEQGARGAHPRGQGSRRAIRTDPDAWRTAVAEAPPVLDYFMDRAVASVDLSSVTGRREVTAGCWACCAGWGIGSSRRCTSSACRGSSTSTRRCSPRSSPPRRARARPQPTKRRRTRERVTATLPALEAETLRVLLATRPPPTISATGRCRSARPPRRPCSCLGGPRRRIERYRGDRDLRRRTGSPRPASWRATCWPKCAPTRVRA